MRCIEGIVVSYILSWYMTQYGSHIVTRHWLVMNPDRLMCTVQIQQTGNGIRLQEPI